MSLKETARKAATQAWVDDLGLNQMADAVALAVLKHVRVATGSTFWIEEMIAEFQPVGEPALPCGDVNGNIRCNLIRGHPGAHYYATEAMDMGWQHHPAPPVEPQPPDTKDEGVRATLQPQLRASDDLRNVLCWVSQIFNGWRGWEEWSTWDEDVAQHVIRWQQTLETIHAPIDQAVGDLLAVIHRDGGHHLAAVGVTQAARDAAIKYYELLTAADEQEARIAELSTSYLEMATECVSQRNRAIAAEAKIEERA